MEADQVSSRLAALGRRLYRRRGWVGAAGYAVVLLFSAASVRSVLLSLPLAVVGMALRVWAAAYIGPIARGREIAVDRRVVGGAYHWFRHPLYVGNTFLVVAVLLALRPPAWVTVLVLVGYVFEYWTIAREEERALAGRQPLEATFSLCQAAAEWHTLAAVAAAYALGLLKAALWA